MNKFFLGFLIYALGTSGLLAQCDTGSEPECTCETAEVLCAVSELDGYSSSMSSFQHPADGPTPFCGGQTQTNNPTWFAFIAWCSDITMEVSFENCTTVNNTEGAQLAVYTDCSFGTQIDCDSECNDNSTAVVAMEGLTIGESYYVMLDGCFGSACDYEVSVSPTDCDEFIEDWEEPVTEDLVVCLGQEVIYDVDELQGATTWHWFLDGDEIEQTDVASHTIVWDVEGQYELCVDASNICLDVDQDPSINCVMITVGDPNAGEISINDSPECPNEFMDIIVSNYNANVTYTQLLIFVDMLGEVVQIVSGNPSTSFTWPTCQEFTVYSLNFPEDEEVPVPDVGDDYAGSDCMFYCCNEVAEMLMFVDEDAPEFDRPPANVTINCLLLLEELDLEDVEILDVEDECAEDAEVMGTEVFLADTCNGGTITREWFFADDCGNAVMHTQTITVLPWAEAQFLNPPIDLEMTSLEYQNFVIPNLMYTNGLSGECQIAGGLPPTIIDNRNGCGGHVLLEYSFTDFCGRVLSATQRIDIVTDVMVSDTTMFLCDEDVNGIVEVIRSDVDNIIADDVTNLIISYYPTEADLEASANEIIFPILSSDLPEQAIYASVTDASGCDSAIRIAIAAAGPPTLNFSSMPEACIGEQNGVVQILQPADLSSYTLIMSGDTVITNTIDSLSPGTYYFTLIDSIGCMTMDSVTIDEGISIDLISVSADCNNNGTATLNDDDYYTLEFIISGPNGQYNLSVGNNVFPDPLNYNEIVSVDVPADGNTITTTVTDVMLGCMSEFESIALTPCSNECELFVDKLEYDCNDNGTPLDGTDDYFDFTVQISSINGGAGNNCNVIIDGNLELSINYGEISNFTVPAQGNTVLIRFEDTTINTCFIEQETEALIPCSNLCQLDIEVLDITCVDPGTPSDNGDDLFEYEINVSAINGSATYSISGVPGSFDYGTTILIQNNLISDGDINIVVTDSNDPLCEAQATITAPAPCSTPCDVELTTFNVLPCDDNGTGSILDDDNFFVEVLIESILGTGSNYLLMDNFGNNYGPYNYSELNMVGPFTADDSDIELILSDATNASCQLNFDFSQSACSECNHSLSLDNSNIINCNTPNTTLTSTVDGMVNTYAWTGPSSFTSDQADITVDMPGEYMLTVTFNDGCMLMDNITVDASLETPVSNAGVDMILNCETNSVTLSAALSNYGPDVVINWLDENNNIISTQEEIEVMQAGTFGLYLFDTVNGCESSVDFVTVEEFLSQPVAIIYAEPSDVLDCNVMSINLSFESEDNTQYNWIIDNETFTDDELTITDPLTISLIAVDTISSCQSDTTISITDFEIYPSITVDAIGSIDCIDDMACVTITTNAIEPQYSWFDSNNNLLSNDPMTFCFESSGNYSVQITDLANGCQNEENISIQGPVLPTIDLPSTVTIVNEESYEFEPDFNVNSNQITSLEWSTTGGILSCNDCLVTMLSNAVDSTIVSLSIVTDEGCTAEAQVLVLVKRIPKIYVPNVFTTDRGEYFTIFTSSDIQRIDELSIYDRWGNLVFTNSNFEPNDPDQGWDGTMNDRNVEQGVYVYVFKYPLDGRTETTFGTITLIR